MNLAPGGQVSGGDAQGDTITGFENIIGSAQADALIGDGGANRLSGGAGNDFIVGGAGDDVVAGGAGADQMYGGPGVDTVDYRGSAAGVVVDLLTGLGSGGDAQGDTIIDFENVIGSGSGDTLRGNAGANALSGGAGGDSLSGGLGRDELVGGLGRDELTGGADADRFEFIRTTESGKTAATRDVIHDFNHGEGDRLVLAIDANADKPGMQTLSFIGSKGFTAPGQVRFFFEGDHTVVEVNTAGKSGAEMQIQLDHHVNLGKGDFAFAD